MSHDVCSTLQTYECPAGLGLSRPGCVLYNLRKLNELPYHLTQSGRSEDLKKVRELEAMHCDTEVLIGFPVFSSS